MIIFLKKKHTKKPKFKLTHQTNDLSHETKIVLLKIN